MESGIYKIKNKVTNDVYIGSAKNFNIRWKEHIKRLKRKNHHSIILQNAWNKYGEQSFDFQIIEYVQDVSKLIDREQYYLDLIKPKYNICKYAYSSLGRKPTEETRKKLRENNGKYWKGKKLSEEHKKKLSLAKKGKPTGRTGLKSPVYGKPSWNKGIPMTEEAKEHLRIILTGRKQSKETIEKRRQKLLGHKGWNKGLRTPYHVRHKISIALKEYHREAQVR
ncbi:MAG: GIY-YIG nuclease family protein [Candidatus Anammoxibacter sp.]